MKYKLIKTDLFLYGRLIPEGEIIELPNEEAETLSSYLELLPEEEKNIKKTKTEKDNKK
mgnify:CR=1 FL=1